MEGVIQGYANPSVSSGEFENIDVFGSVHSKLGNVRRIEVLTAQNGGRPRCKPLIQQ